VLFEHGYCQSDRVEFSSRSGALRVARDGNMLAMDFPRRPPLAVDLDRRELTAALGAEPVEVLGASSTSATVTLLAVYRRQGDVEALRPDFAKVRALDAFAVIATAPGNDCDFVSRFFAPRAGIDEDPVTGSAHCTLAPFWSARLGKTQLCARQVSDRGGVIFCEDGAERVVIGGRAVEYLRGEITV
jgi:predicted PhzF superfamily epimerase YddE/YHI9